MNNYPNSDCKQCTKSKLGPVHSAHTQGPGCAHAAPRSRASHVLGAISCPPSCSVAGASCHVASRTYALSRHVVAPLSRYKNCITTQKPMPRAQRRVAARTHALLRHVATCLAIPCHNKKICIATHSCGQVGRVAAPPSHVACRVAASCCARQLGRIAPSCPLSQYNLLYRDPNWKMGSSSPSSLLCTLFFFFICSTHCKITNFFFFSYLQ